MKKKFIKIAVWTSAVLVLLFTVLVVHIYVVTKHRHYDNNNLQLSRIDFKQEVDATEAAKIGHFVKGLPGVENALFNLNDRTLVYGYMTGQQSATNVYNALMAFGHYKAQLFVPDASQLATGCPVGKDKGLMYTLSATIAKWF